MHCTNSVQTINDLLISLIINFSDVILLRISNVYKISFNKFPIFHINVRSLNSINIMQKGTYRKESIVLIAKKIYTNFFFSTITYSI